MNAEPTFECNDGSLAENSLECTVHNGTISIRIENPWAGSTETGFGATCYVGLSTEKARELAAWLSAVTANSGEVT